MSITYSKFVFVVLGMQHAMRMRHIVICGLPGSTVFLHISHEEHDCLKKPVIEPKMCFDVLYRLCLEHF
jgi:hypothetical protein